MIQRFVMRTSSFTLSILAAGLLLTGCTNQGASEAGEKTSQLAGRVEPGPVNYQIATIAEGLDHPWSLAFLPDGNMLVTERTGKLLLIGADGAKRTLRDFNDNGEFPSVHFGDGIQAGLFDVVLHPGFEENGQIYVSYTGELENSENTLLLMRFTYADGEISGGEQLFAASPSRIQGNHYGARFVFLPDDTLLMPVGDAFHFREEAQSLDNHFGKIVRLNDNGSVPTDNPFLQQGGALPEIWSYGHRNPQGIILTADGRVLENEHGPAGGDEINEIKRGANYGWPTVTYALDYSGGRVSPFEALEGTEQSLVHFTPSIAPSGFAQYSGEAFPDWEGDLFLSALALKHVRQIDMKADGSLGKQQELFGELDVRFRDVRTGPDGFLYLLTEEPGQTSRILKVMPG
ncbi:PQQ-dependent sugar dehydrogenase [Altererythrobacter sp.]|uniref:PQQ-dependent sugar dehydrogenase n=2 Tax=Altererythrobacter sp. TaxID=1872480 RepID=UPI001B1E4A7E|nr:PQQ-dependent sugar dehydrogenase [Altererythrobacter sp.]MBO6610145.1 PQQ-dependent sugar dehydrogenase [Altererythrobacter sp.]MBO6641858.1 PQQ-dependent sugar dehydrogenase [Altererythrobacter sp.]MBO6709754.1 PQQ-dependent sugar dehydrogenase [Altererythrobacter sp.]